MATKRMFSNSVIDSDAFYMLSVEAQLLYFHIGLKADDDGFVSVLKICRILGFNDGPLRELENAGFIIRGDGGVVVIVHWRINNTLKNDRYHESRYTSFKKRLSINENGMYTILEPEWNQSGTESTSSLGELRKAQESLEKESPAQHSVEEESPERGRAVFQAAKDRGIRLNAAVQKVLLEELEQQSEEEVIHMMDSRPNFLERLKLLAKQA